MRTLILRPIIKFTGLLVREGYYADTMILMRTLILRSAIKLASFLRERYHTDTRYRILMRSLVVKPAIYFIIF